MLDNQTTPTPEAENLQATSENTENVTNMDALQTQINQLTEQLAQAQNAHLRTAADAENARKRHLEELDKTRKFAIENFASQTIAVMDALNAALLDTSGDFNTLKQGVEMTQKQLQGCFDKFKIAEVDPINQPLNATLHQAISTMPSEQAVNTVIQVLQKGYTMNERLLRPALVITSNGQSDTSTSTPAS